LGCEPNFNEVLVDSRCQIHRITNPVIQIQDRLRPIRFLYKLSVTLTNGLLWPDFYRGWAKRLFRRFKKNVGEYDRVVAFVFPPSVYLAEKYGLIDKKWIFDLQESVSPQFNQVPRRSPLQRGLTPKLFEMEKAALHSSGGVVFTANTNRLKYIEEGLVPIGSNEHIPYFYDSEVFKANSTVISDGFKIFYFGGFDWQGNRTPEVFLKSLAAFFQLVPEARDETEFVFYGAWLKEHDYLIDDLNLRDVVYIHAAVSYEDYLNKIKSAPVLLLVVAADHNLFMPSKIVDYFGSKRPILAYVPEGSEVFKILLDAKMSESTVVPNDIDGGTQAIVALWKLYVEGCLRGEGGETNFWSSEVQLNKYIELVDDLGA